MSCVSILLGYSSSEPDVCRRFYNAPQSFYSNYTNLAQSTGIYTNSICTQSAPSGYYSNGVIVRYWDSVTKSLAKSKPCVLPMLFNPCCNGLDRKTFTVNVSNFSLSLGSQYAVLVHEGNCYQFSPILSNSNPDATYLNATYTSCTDCLDINPCPTTPTPTPTLTTTPTPLPTSIYLSGCCDSVLYVSQNAIEKIVGSTILIGPYNFCYKVVNKPIDAPSRITPINDNSWMYVDGCTDIKCQTCPPPPTSTIVTPPTPPNVLDPCSPVTILPLGVSCNLTQPTSNNLNSGILDLIITGGTPPYTVTWNPGGNGQTLYGQSPGIYTATVTDLWKDFTATTTCTLEVPLMCGFDISVTEVIPNTPTPTPTPTNTPTKTIPLTPTPTKTPKGPVNTQTPTRTPTPTLTPTKSTKGPINTQTPTPTRTLTPTPTTPECGCYVIINLSDTLYANGYYYNCNGDRINVHLNPTQVMEGICSNGSYNFGGGDVDFLQTGQCDANCQPLI